MDAENHRLQDQPSEGDRDTVERELKRQDDKLKQEKAAKAAEDQAKPA
ncbi:IS30 family transposase [Neorhizobium galegae]|nr:hypothetical protein [Neorhizobium galegae]MBP2550712.1 IS30 family transposase [Neorhizobium galegae]